MSVVCQQIWIRVCWRLAADC